jgi:hypothetical protein
VEQFPGLYARLRLVERKLIEDVYNQQVGVAWVDASQCIDLGYPMGYPRKLTALLRRPTLKNADPGHLVSDLGDSTTHPATDLLTHS